MTSRTRLSANLGFLWPRLPLLERIAAAGAAGFKAVELHAPYDIEAELVREACRTAGVQLISINTPRGPRPGDAGLAALPGREEDFAAAFALSLSYATAADARNIHVLAGTVPDIRETASVLVANLRSAADKAAAGGRVLLLEALNTRDNPGYFYSRVERAAEIARETDRPNVRLMFDAYHVGVGQGDVLSRLELLFPLIGHVQIASVPARAEPDEGTVDFRDVIRTLERLGYRGWVGCEYKPRGDTDAGLKWREEFGLAPRRLQR